MNERMPVGQSSMDQLLSAAENLSPEEQEDLVSIIRHRLAEKGRKRIAADIKKSRQEHKAGRGKSSSVDELMREIKS